MHHLAEIFPNLRTLDVSICSRYSHLEAAAREEHRQANVLGQAHHGTSRVLRSYTGSILSLYLFALTCHIPSLELGFSVLGHAHAAGRLCADAPRTPSWVDGRDPPGSVTGVRDWPSSSPLRDARFFCLVKVDLFLTPTRQVGEPVFELGAPAPSLSTPALTGIGINSLVHSSSERSCSFLTDLELGNDDVFLVGGAEHKGVRGSSLWVYAPVPDAFVDLWAILPALHLSHHYCFRCSSSMLYLVTRLLPILRLFPSNSSFFG